MSRSISVAYTMKKKQKKAQGGEVSSPEPKPYQKSNQEAVNFAASQEKDRDALKSGQYKEGEHKPLNPKADGPGYADGGDVVEKTPDQAGSAPPCPTCGQVKMSEGGVVANDTGEGAAADELPNEFDDLVLDDKQSPKQPKDSNEDGDSKGEDYKKDVVARAMLKRKAKR